MATNKYFILSLLIGLGIGFFAILNPWYFDPKYVLVTLFSFTLLFLSLVVFTLYAHKYLLKGAPFVRTKGRDIEAIIKLAGLKKGDKVADLGSGDGKIIKSLLNTNAELHGYEINPFLVLASRLTTFGKANVFFHFENFWNVDLSDYDVIIVYGIEYIMRDLEKKLKKELKKGARVISNQFTFPTLTYARKIENIYLYTPFDEQK